MATAQLGTLLRHIERLAAPGGMRQGTDRQLLEDFAARHDEAAFATLVSRHGPMVLRVCRRVLHHEQDAEDAFQATFLVLARQAASIRQREALAGFLHGVAYRTALKAKRSAARRRNHEARLRDRTPAVRPSPSWEDVQAVLDEEIHRLPEWLRGVFVLCVLEGKSGPQAAAVLGCKPGTVSSRLTRARQTLQRRLARRGIKLSALLASLLLLDSTSEAGISGALVGITIRSGLRVAAGEPAAGFIPAHIAELAMGVTRTMLPSKAKIVTMILLAVGLLTASAGALAYRGFAANETDQPTPPAKPAPEPPAAKPVDEAIKVTGRVLNPNGKPVAGAQVYLSRYTEQVRIEPKIRTTSGSDGRFRLSVARLDVDRNETIVAEADGYGPAWAELSQLDKAGRLADLRLVPDDIPITGRVLSLEGRPIRAATVRVVRVRKMPDEDLTPWIKDLHDAVGKSLFDLERAKKMLEYERTLKTVWGLRGAPHAVKTDADGRFSLKGFGRERVVELAIEGPTIEHRHVLVVTRSNLPKGMPPYVCAARFDHLAAAPKLIEGTIREKGTGRPAKGIRVHCAFISPTESITNLIVTRGLQTTSDERGRYRLLGVPKSKQYRVAAGGGPYFISSQAIDDTPGTDPLHADFELERGIVVRGRLTDKATGKPVRGSVFYVPRPENSHLKDYPKFSEISANMAEIEKDGSFTMAIVPGPGLICARAEEDRFVRADASGLGAKPPTLLKVVSFHAIVPIDPVEKDQQSRTCDVALDPGRTVNGTVLGTDGKPLDGVFVAGLTAAYSPTDASPVKRKLSSAAFTALGLDPSTSRILVFWHEEKKLGRAVGVRGDETEPLIVRLEPLAAVAGRLVDAAGKPQEGVEVRARYNSRQKPALPGELSSAFSSVFPVALPLPKATTGQDGCFRLQGFIPGMKYDLIAVRDGKPVAELAEDVDLLPGKTKELGDVRIKR